MHFFYYFYLRLSNSIREHYHQTETEIKFITGIPLLNT